MRPEKESWLRVLLQLRAEQHMMDVADIAA